MRKSFIYGFGFVFALLLLTLPLSGCGYHIRKQNVLPPPLYTMYLVSPSIYGEFESTLRNSLQLLGVKIYNHPVPGMIHLHILDYGITYATPTIGGSNQARVLNLYFQVIFELLDGQNQILLPPQTVKTSSSLVINPGEALESTNQLTIQKYEMQKEVCRMMINILNSPRLFQATGF